MTTSNTPDSPSQPSQEPARRTATPWAYRPALNDDWGWIRGPEPDNGEIAPLVACARSGNWDDAATHDAHRAAGTDPYGANAAFIVEAVNNHRALVEALRLAEAVLNEYALRQGPIGALLPIRKALSDVGATYLVPQSSGVARAEQESGK